MGVTVNDLVVYRYEKQPFDFRVGELLHNFNGNDYRVMENYGGGDVLLMQMNTGMFVVAEGIEAYKRYPKDVMPTAFPIFLYKYHLYYRHRISWVFTDNTVFGIAK